MLNLREKKFLFYITKQTNKQNALREEKINQGVRKRSNLSSEFFFIKLQYISIF